MNNVDCGMNGVTNGGSNMGWIAEAYADLSVCMAEVDNLVNTPRSEMGTNEGTLNRVRELCAEHRKLTRSNQAGLAAIRYAAGHPSHHDFLRCWLDGQFEIIRKEYPDAPEDVFIF